MGLRQRLFQFVYQQMLERPAQRQSFDQLISALETQGSAFTTRLARLNDTLENREQLRHIIGIERWGQRRLQTLLGEPFVRDEYDGYRPHAAVGWQELQEAFVQTRAATVALARTLHARGIAKTATAEHNDAGSVSVGGWLHYFVQHAASEGTRMR